MPRDLMDGKEEYFRSMPKLAEKECEGEGFSDGLALASSCLVFIYFGNSSFLSSLCLVYLLVKQECCGTHHEGWSC